MSLAKMVYLVKPLLVMVWSIQPTVPCLKKNHRLIVHPLFISIGANQISLYLLEKKGRLFLLITFKHGQIAVGHCQI
jgi:hypothetical protein